MSMVAAVGLRALLATAVRRASAAPVARRFHASPAALARQSRRGGRVARAAAAKPSAFEDRSDGESDDEDSAVVAKSKKKATFFTKDELEENPNLLADAVDDDDDEEEHDQEMEEFLEGVEELFTLGSKDFGRRLVREDDAAIRDAESDDDEADDDEDEVDRAERIPKKRLLKMLDEFDATKPRGGKNAEGMAIPKTKIAAPLEKKTKKFDAERVSHRQERIELTVLGYVQNLLLEDSDLMETDVFAHLVEASVSPDLRRIVLYWEPARRNSENQIIAKKKAEGVQKRLEKLEKFFRMSVTRHLNLKYSPIVQFKRYKETRNDESRALFDREMAWLDRFK